MPILSVGSLDDCITNVNVIATATELPLCAAHKLKKFSVNAMMEVLEVKESFVNFYSMVIQLFKKFHFD